MHGLIAASADSSAWTYGAAILSFAFPMLLFVVVAAWLYVTYTKPELVPGHRNLSVERPIIHTQVPGTPPPPSAVNDQKADQNSADQNSADQNSAGQNKARTEDGE